MLRARSETVELMTDLIGRLETLRAQVAEGKMRSGVLKEEWERLRISHTLRVAVFLTSIQTLEGALQMVERSRLADEQLEALHAASAARFEQSYASRLPGWGDVPGSVRDGRSLAMADP